MDIPSHDAEPLCHADAVGVKGVELEVLVETHEEYDKGRDGYKEFF